MKIELGQIVILKLSGDLRMLSNYKFRGMDKEFKQIWLYRKYNKRESFLSETSTCVWHMIPTYPPSLIRFFAVHKANL